MIALAAGILWVGYGMASWGWCLIQGYDVPVTGWLNPFHPYEWPADGNPGFVRKGQIFPGGAPGAASTSTGTSSGTGTSPGGGGAGMPTGKAGGRGQVLGG